MYRVLLQGTDASISPGPLVDECICKCLCSYMGVEEEAQGRKQELDAQGNHPGLSWCGQEVSWPGLKCQSGQFPKKPRGLVLIDSGWTGVGGLLVEHMLT